MSVADSIKYYVDRFIPARYTLYLRAWKHYLFGERELRTLKSLIDKNRGGVDVGANMGTYTYFMSKYCLFVHAFEPNPTCYEYLKQLESANLHVHHLAISDREKDVTLHVPIIDGRLIRGLGALRSNSAGEERKYDVRAISLDSIDLSNIGIIKIDVEGHEIDVIRGASKLIAREKPILFVEIEQRHLNVNMKEVIQEIQSFGYDLYALDNGKIRRKKINDVIQNQERYRNDVYNKKYMNMLIFMLADN